MPFYGNVKEMIIKIFCLPKIQTFLITFFQKVEIAESLLMPAVCPYRQITNRAVPVRYESIN